MVNKKGFLDMENVFWHLPGICDYGVINQLLFDTMRKKPELFRDGYKIGSVYGTFPSAIWNGGRADLRGISKRKEVEDIIKSYNVLGIPVRFTWTNVLLEEKHVYDTYCNMIMDAGNNGMNQVLVNSPVLEDYIRKNYPGYKLVSSTTKRIISVDRLMEELAKDYQLVVLDYDLNHNEKVIEKLLPLADRIEILVNETCQPNCPQRANHYREMSRCQLEYEVSKKLESLCTDRSPDARTFKGCMKRPAFMSTANIDEYVEKGFRNFKIVGRSLSEEFYMDSLIYFLVKAECREQVRKIMNETLLRLRNMNPRK